MANSRLPALLLALALALAGSTMAAANVNDSAQAAVEPITMTAAPIGGGSQEDVLKWDFTPVGPEDEDVKRRFAAKVGASGGAADPKAISHEGHRRQLADFVDAVRTGRPPKVDGREGKRSVELICAIYESARTGRVVDLKG